MKDLSISECYMIAGVLRKERIENINLYKRNGKGNKRMKKNIIDLNRVYRLISYKLKRGEE